MKEFIINFPVPWADVHGEDIIFDMDGTLVDGDLGETVFYRSLLDASAESSEDHESLQVRGQPAALLTSYRESIIQGQLTKAYRMVAEWLDVLPAETVASAAREILEANAAPHVIHVMAQNAAGMHVHELRYGARLKADMQRMIETLQQWGARCWIVSASPQMICEMLGGVYNIPDERVLGVRSQNGSVHIPWHLEKVMVLKEHGVTAPLVAFGDSVGDREMLCFARHQVVMQDGDPALVREAKEQGWHIFG